VHDLEHADAARSGGDLAAVAAHCRTALGRWRGQRFLGELGAEPFAAAEAARLEGLRRQALRTRLDAELELGHHDAVVGELEAALHAEPFDEHLWAQLMVAHHRAGRPLDALLPTGGRTAGSATSSGSSPDRACGPSRPASSRRTRRSRRGPGTWSDGRPHRTRPTCATAGPRSSVGKRSSTRWWHEVATHRLVTVVGTGGVGKTRLAVEAGWRLLADVPGGVWDVDLAPIADPSTIARPLALALQVPYRAGEVGLAATRNGSGWPADDPAARQLRAPARRRGGARHRAAVPLRGLRIIATSQQPLGVEGEAVVPLAPLSIEDGTALELFARPGPRGRARLPGHGHEPGGDR
jgi:hypothetical protein